MSYFFFATAAIVSRIRTRRDRFRVLGKQFGPALHDPHECVRAGCRQPGAAVPALVRPDHRVPHLHHSLEPTEYHVIR